VSSDNTNSVNVLHALAECVGNKLVVQDIEAVGGKLSTEHLCELQLLVMNDVMTYRFEENWPPTIHVETEDDGK